MGMRPGGEARRARHRRAHYGETAHEISEQAFAFEYPNTEALQNTNPDGTPMWQHYHGMDAVVDMVVETIDVSALHYSRYSRAATGWLTVPRDAIAQA